MRFKPMRFRVLSCFILIVSVAQAQHHPVHIPREHQSVRTKGIDPTKSPLDYAHSVWTSEQGLPQNSATALCQTRDGYLWIGTGEGLVRFDGISMKVFSNTNTPGKSHYVNALVEDRESGALWIGTGGGLLCMKNGSFKRFSTQNGLFDDYIYSLLQDRDGVLWVGTGGGVNRLSQDNNGNAVFTGYTTDNGLAGNKVYSIIQDSDGSFLMGTWGGGVSRLVFDSKGNAVFKTYTTRDGLLSDSIRSLLRESDGTLWIGSSGGLNRLKNGVMLGFTVKNGLSHHDVLSLLHDQEGSLWIGTNGGGVNRLRYEEGGKAVFTSLSTNNGLSHDIVRALAQDREGALWIGTYGGGLNRVRDGVFTCYTTKNGLSNDHVTSVLQDREGTFWFGTAGGGLNCLKNGIFTGYTTKNGLAHNHIQTLHLDHEGALLIGSWGGGLNRLKNGVVTNYSPQPNLTQDVVRSLLQDGDGALWIGTSAGLSRLKGSVFSRFTTQNGLSNDDVQTLLLDSNALWIGTWGGGLNLLENGKFKSYTTKQGLSNDYVRSLFHDRDGVLWIGTDGGGLNRLKDGKLSAITTKNGLFDDIVRCILEDDYGYFWISCNKGIYCVRKSDLNAIADGNFQRLSCTAFGTADGMKNVQCTGVSPAGWKDYDGCLWFPTRMGVVKVNPKTVHENPLPPPVIIEEMKADDDTTIDLSANAILAAGVEKLEFRYTATSLLAPERVQFRYMLEGYDKDWTDAGVRRTAYYTHLPRGREYRFRVIACNNYGVWNKEGASVVVYLAPYFWETWWFTALCGVVVMVAGYGLYRLRTRQLHLRSEELERIVQERTTELQEKNIELEQLNAEKIEFLGIAAHDLKNPLSGIQGTAELLMTFEENLSYDERRKFVSSIYHSSERMFELIKNLLDVNALEDGGMALRLVSFDLNALLNHTIDQYSVRAERKQIRLFYECAESMIVFADEQATIQVLENLVSNAVKYSPLGKNIFVRVTALHEKVRVEIQDEGPGISEEDKLKLFGRFARLSAQPTGDEHSTGLGLSIVKKLVEAMNAKVWCESELGKGAMFVVELPKGKAIADYQPPTE